MKIFNFIHTKNNSNKNYSDAIFLTHNIAKMQKLDSSTLLTSLWGRKHSCTLLEGM